MRGWFLLALLVCTVACSSDDPDEMFEPLVLCPPDGVVDLGRDFDLPVIIPETKTTPVYPEAARIDRIEGRVILLLSLATDGTQCGIEVLDVEPTGWGFEDASVDAVSTWVYEPAMQDGKAVSTYHGVRVDFQLQ